jgi:2,4-dienoyl-CoA reductase-like NADH-dependent reductase (Old Yellow Enzyme family)
MVATKGYQRTPKLLTFVDLGALALSHRVVVFVPPVQGRRIAPAYTQPAPSGGLVIQPFVPDQDIWGPSVHQHLPGARMWSRINDAVRAKGGTSVAQISSAFAATPYEPEVWRSRAASARAAGFDGIEVNATRHAGLLSMTPLLETVQAMIDVWGADRVGLQLAPFAWMTGQDDERAAGFYRQLLSAVAEMEIAYLHISGAFTPDRGDMSTSALGQCLRKSFPGMVIASGFYTPASAITAVQRRWADAIGFTLVTGYGDQLIRAIRAVGPPD